MSRFLLSATLAAAVALAGCDTYGLDGTTPPGTTPPGTTPPGTTPPGEIDTAALAAALGCDAVATASTGGSIGGSLVESDCVLGAGRFPEHDGGEFLDGYAFRVTDSTAVRLDLDAGAYDPVLVLLDENLEVVAFNDDRTPGDPAGDEGATIAETLAPGVYVAVSTSFFDGAQGTYLLVMTEE